MSQCRSSAVKRLIKEKAELERFPSSEFSAEPVEDNILEWHFTIKGGKDTSFENGICKNIL